MNDTAWIEEHDWWSNGRGWIRRVTLAHENNRIAYCCWHHFGPVLFWFNTFEEAVAAWDGRGAEIAK